MGMGPCVPAMQYVTKNPPQSEFLGISGTYFFNELACLYNNFVRGETTSHATGLLPDTVGPFLDMA